MSLITNISKLKRALFGEPTTEALDLLPIALPVIDLEHGLPKSLDYANATTAGAPVSGTVITTLTVPADGWYQVRARAYVVTALAAARGCDLAVMNEQAQAQFIDGARFAVAIGSELTWDLGTIFLRANQSVRLFCSTSYAGVETVFGSVTFIGLYRG